MLLYVNAVTYKVVAKLEHFIMVGAVEVKCPNADHPVGTRLAALLKARTESFRAELDLSNLTTSLEEESSFHTK